MKWQIWRKKYLEGDFIWGCGDSFYGLGEAIAWCNLRNDKPLTEKIGSYTGRVEDAELLLFDPENPKEPLFRIKHIQDL